MSSNDNKSCFKCGKIGHLASECTDDHVSLEINSYEDKVQNEINIIYSNALKSKKYQTDEFGPFHPNPPAEKNGQQNWSNTIFCFNCGESGHSVDNCPHPSFESFYQQIQKSLTEQNTENGSEIKEKFDSIWNNQ